MKLEHQEEARVHPVELMRAVQECVIDETSAILLVESGNGFGWANRYLRLAEPGRYRVSMRWGSLGHAAAGVIGAAQVHAAGAVALCGDGAMLFSQEVSTAVALKLRAIWIVLNDAGYGSCIAGQRSRGLSEVGLEIPRVDFASYAQALGAAGARVDRAEELSAALRAALGREGPSLVDVWMREAKSPLDGRFAMFFGAKRERRSARPVKGEP